MGISSIASVGWKYVKRAGKLYPDFVLGTGNEKFTKAMRETINNRKLNNQSYFESVWSGIKNGTLKAEQHNALMQKRYGGFWQSTWAALKTFPDKVAQGWRVGGMLADKAGKTGVSKFWSQFSGSLSGIGKRMPLIGTLIIGLTELPNIFSAFKDEGLIGGLKETGKSGLRLGAGIAGAAIGQALIPIPVVGSLVGYAVGDWLMSKFTGKSHSEKKAEAEDAIKQQQLALQQMQQQGMNPFAQGGFNVYPGMNSFAQGGFNIYPGMNQMQPQLNIPQPTMSPQQLMALKQMLYSNSMANPMDQDFMAMATGMNNLNFQC